MAAWLQAWRGMNLLLCGWLLLLVNAFLASLIPLVNPGYWWAPAHQQARQHIEIARIVVVALFFVTSTGVQIWRLRKSLNQEKRLIR